MRAGILVGMDAARYLVAPERWERLPADWGEVFGREAALAVEIGFGNGSSSPRPR